MRIEFSFYGDQQVNRELQRFSDRAGDAEPAFEAMADLMRRRTERQFNTQGRYASGGWEPLKDSTRARKAAEGLDPRILHAHLALRNSLTEEGAEGAMEVILPHMMTWGTLVEYAGFHQTGTRTMPRRRPIEFTEATRRQLVKILQRYLVTGSVTTPGGAL